MLIDILISVLENKSKVDTKSSIFTEVNIFHDFLMEIQEPFPQLYTYVKRTADPQNLRLSTLLEAIAKFGTKPERHLIRKAMRLTMRSYRKKKNVYRNIRHDRLNRWNSFLIRKILANLKMVTENAVQTRTIS